MVNKQFPLGESGKEWHVSKIKPTDTEIGILRILWEHGPSTVREVHESICKEKAVGYTTALKLLQVMTEKGLVKRDETARSHVYEPAEPEETTQRHLVSDLMERAFGGSARNLVLQALSAKKATPREVREIRRLLDEYEGRKKP